MNKTVAITLLCVAIAILIFVMVFMMSNRSFSGPFWVRRNTFESSPGTEAATSLEYSAADVEQLEVSLVSENVEISKGTGSMIRIEQTAWGEIDEDHRIRASLDGGVLTVQSGRYTENPFSWGNGNFFQCTVKISVPGDYLNSANVDTVSGEIGYTDVSCRHAEFSTTSGNIDLSGFACDDLDTETTSGDIKIRNVSCSQLDTDSTSGDMVIEADVDGTLSADSTSGSVRFLGNARTANVQTLSGEVELETDGSEQLEVQTASGGVDIISHEVSRLQEIRVDTMSGNVGIALPEQAQVNLDASTMSGDIYTDNFDGSVQLSGRGGIRVQADTASGDIRFRNASGTGRGEQVSVSAEPGRSGKGQAEIAG